MMFKDQPISSKTEVRIKNDTEASSRSVETADLFVVVTSLVISLLEVFSAIAVAVWYAVVSDILFCLLTFLFIVFPLVVLQLFSVRWYATDGRSDCSRRLWLLHMLFPQPFERLVHLIILWSSLHRSPANPDATEKLLLRNNDVCMLRLFGVFLGSASHVTLQVYIVYAYEPSWIAVVSSCMSLLSIGWAVSAYNYALRRAYCPEYRFSISTFGLQMSGSICIVVSRVISIVAFTAIFRYWIILAVAVHWLAMTVWLVRQKTEFCSTKVEEFMFRSVVGVIHCFCFFNVKDGQTRFRSAAFHAVCLAENVAMVTLWYCLVDSYVVTTTFDLKIVVLASMLVSFALGVGCQLIYYCAVHASRRKRSETEPGNGSIDLPTTVDFETLQPCGVPEMLTSTGILPRRSLKSQTSQPQLRLTLYTPSRLLSPIRTDSDGATDSYRRRTPVDQADDSSFPVAGLDCFQHYSIDASACLRPSFLLPETPVDAGKLTGNLRRQLIDVDPHGGRTNLNSWNCKGKEGPDSKNQRQIFFDTNLENGLEVSSAGHIPPDLCVNNLSELHRSVEHEPKLQRESLKHEMNELVKGLKRLSDGFHDAKKRFSSPDGDELLHSSCFSELPSAVWKRRSEHLGGIDCQSPIGVEDRGEGGSELLVSSSVAEDVSLSRHGDSGHGTTSSSCDNDDTTVGGADVVECDCRTPPPSRLSGGGIVRMSGSVGRGINSDVILETLIIRDASTV